MKRDRHTITAGLVVAVVASAIAGERPQRMTGDARVDFFPVSVHALMRAGTLGDSLEAMAQDTLQPTPTLSDRMRSPWLAAGISLAIPGGGELYAENYWHAIGFIGVETVAWIIAASYDSEGNRQTDQFRSYADAHWSAVNYAIWINNNRGGSIDMTNSALPPWERVNWDSLNFYERLAGFGFTHVLPRHGDQQYYELIGKYDQYSPGWDDYAGATDPNGVPIPSARFLEYSAMRGKANDYYSIASTAIKVIVVNHVLSAVHAYFSAQGYNRRIQTEAKLNMRHTPLGVFAEPMGTIRVSF